ncbi:hypothetical protein C2E31_24770 [Rhodopirellula baltica]|nr:hypothetical protein C2E31_24770 [Rhodopirellula baltica]
MPKKTLDRRDWRDIARLALLLAIVFGISAVYRRDFTNLHIPALAIVAACSTRWIGKKWWIREIENYDSHATDS